jgi:dipeptidyl aminopeptidase/acylaminoacyl peptidase
LAESKWIRDDRQLSEMKLMTATPLAKVYSGCFPRAVHFAFFLLTFGAFSMPLLAESAEALFTPQHVSRLRTVASAAISPDGKHIAYTLIVPRDPLTDENGTAWVELHVVDRNGRSRPFVTGKVAVSGVQWTPDGQHLAFLTRRGDDANTSLYTIPIDGGEAVRRLQHGSDIQQVAFRNDGRQLAFRAVEPLAKDQQSYREKGFNQEIFEEDWRPTKVWIAAADGSGSPRALPLEGSAFDVAWSPAGPQLAVVLAPTPLVDDSYMFKRVSVVDADTGRVLQRVHNPGKLGAIAWSPDGRQLAMISGVDIHDPADGRLMIAAVPGDGSLRDLLPNDETHVNSFAWKDDRTLIWAADEGTQTTVGEVDLDGNRRVMPWSNAAVFSQLTLSDDARSVALVGNTPQHPGEVFAWSVDDDAAGRLTVNNDWLAGLRFANQEVVRWNARDGLELEGVLVYPLNYQPGQRYPLIMTVHGGPEAHVSNGWVTQYHSAGQVGAARGFAVFYPNYRGSTGRGVEFTKLGQADAAGKEFDDLVDGVDHLIATGSGRCQESRRHRRFVRRLRFGLVRHLLLRSLRSQRDVCRHQRQSFEGRHHGHSRGDVLGPSPQTVVGGLGLFPGPQSDPLCRAASHAAADLARQRRSPRRRFAVAGDPSAPEDAGPGSGPLGVVSRRGAWQPPRCRAAGL